MDINEAVKEVKKLLSEGKTNETIVKALTKKGFSEDDALQVISRVQVVNEAEQTGSEKKKELSEKYLRHLVTGFISLAIGLIITIYSFSHSSGGEVIIAPVAILVGIIWLIQGLVGWLKNRKIH
ncbi:MAG: hypothetical protein GTO45_24670 [Candidatus Aminicenantes bacterium]|nr:hypothetical protein [Candidatus Aminicenantes bacterium]NIM81950.1 hypothetical protein [Candidatus Aminicenantes bacterium]NIN21326.1 hypothetical protein [Candidatus Aminicenantes bacterium]NIN45147.1 hypothetical protein [Candidatus Aminicenantes bacterium]NIN87964.1 hypothetical protein [Candidatus Aminicenantes bacterium]